MDISLMPTNEQELDSFLHVQTTLLSKNPAFIGRLSGNEPYLCEHIITGKPLHSYLFQNMLFGAGIQFCSESDLLEYVHTYKNAFNNCDLIGVWCGIGQPMYTQSHFLYNHIKTLNNNPHKCVPFVVSGLEPFYYMDSSQYAFDQIFQNKKVLIISSHANTIKSQLPKLDKLFPKPIFHPTTKFYVHKPPQQNGGSHDTNSWKYHLHELKNELSDVIKEFDFDIALISCGGFGMPIAEHIYSQLGKSSVYVGGGLQIFFGIMGSRWENNPKIKKYVNEYWVRPMDIDRPANVKYCEDGCYW